MKIYNVTIGCFNRLEKRDISYRYEIADRSLKHIECISYNGEMVDINNASNRYKTVKRTRRSGYLDSDQDIKLYTVYGLYVKSPHPNDYTLREKALLQAKALKTLFKLKLEEKQDAKVLKKTK